VKNKLLYSIILTIIFTLLIITSLVIIRQKTANYLLEIQSYSNEIDKIKYDLSQGLIPEKDISNASSTINEVSSIIDKALNLNKIILPLILIVLILLYQLIYWKINSKTNLIKIFLSSIIPLTLLALLILSIINYADYKLFLQGENNLTTIIILIILLILTSYLSLIFKIYNKLDFKVLRNLKNILNYLIYLILNSIYIVLIAAIFVLSYIEYSIIIPAISLLILIFLNEWHMKYFISKL